MPRNFESNSNLCDESRDLRRNMTPEEKHLWYDFLKTYPVQFNRQRVIGNYIVDFYCRKANLVIEIDGKQHYIPDPVSQEICKLYMEIDRLKEELAEIKSLPRGEGGISEGNDG